MTTVMPPALIFEHDTPAAFKGEQLMACADTALLYEAIDIWLTRNGTGGLARSAGVMLFRLAREIERRALMAIVRGREYPTALFATRPVEIELSRMFTINYELGRKNQALAAEVTRLIERCAQLEARLGALEADPFPPEPAEFAPGTAVRSGGFVFGRIIGRTDWGFANSKGQWLHRFDTKEAGEDYLALVVGPWLQ